MTAYGVAPQTVPRAAVPQILLDGLRQRLGDRFVTGDAVRAQHGKDESYHASVAPDGVAFCHSTQEVADIVTLCARHRVPVIPFGTGTGLEGGVAALAGGISMDLSGMNRVLRVDAEDLDCRVQAGVTRKQLNAFLRDTGLFFPIDPGADASIGGMVATGASGTNAVRYGTMKEVVLGLTVVTADGQVITTGGRARKSSAGYDLTRLMVGSEGTLGIVTEVGLRLFGIPEAVSSAVCHFPTVDAAVQTVITTIQAGVPMARIEFLNASGMDAVARYSKLDYAAKPTLFFEFHGSETAVAEQAELVGAIAGECGGEGFQWASQAEQRAQLWQARHDAYYASLALRPGASGMTTDVCVPISHLARAIADTEADIAESGLMAPIVGHVGDGNYHVVFLIDPEDEREVRQAAALHDRMVDRALGLGGTCTGEHGVGYGKIGFLEQECGAGAVHMMRAIKTALDPHNLMNPGKVVRL